MRGSLRFLFFDHGIVFQENSILFELDSGENETGEDFDEDLLKKIAVKNPMTNHGTI